MHQQTVGGHFARNLRKFIFLAKYSRCFIYYSNCANWDYEVFRICFVCEWDWSM